MPCARVLCSIYVLGRRGSKARDLYHNWLVPSLCEVIPAGWFGVKAAGRESFEFRLFEFVAVSEVPRPADHGGHPIIPMRMRRNLSVRRYSQHDRVHASLIR